MHDIGCIFNQLEPEHSSEAFHSTDSLVRLHSLGECCHENPVLQAAHNDATLLPGAGAVYTDMCFVVDIEGLYLFLVINNRHRK